MDIFKRQQREYCDTATTLKTHCDERVISGRPSGAQAGLSEVRLSCKSLF